MKRIILAFMTLMAFVLSSPIHADPTRPATQEEMITPNETPAPEEETPAEVSEAPPEYETAAKKRRWGNIALAFVAIAVATTALILVSRNHHHKH